MAVTLCTFNVNNLYVRYRFGETFPGDASRKSAVTNAEEGYLPMYNRGRSSSSTRRSAGSPASAQPRRQRIPGHRLPAGGREPHRASLLQRAARGRHVHMTRCASTRATCARSMWGCCPAAHRAARPAPERVSVRAFGALCVPVRGVCGPAQGVGVIHPCARRRRAATSLQRQAPGIERRVLSGGARPGPCRVPPHPSSCAGGRAGLRDVTADRVRSVRQRRGVARLADRRRDHVVDRIRTARVARGSQEVLGTPPPCQRAEVTGSRWRLSAADASDEWPTHGAPPTPPTEQLMRNRGLRFVRWTGTIPTRGWRTEGPRREVLALPPQQRCRRKSRDRALQAAAQSNGRGQAEGSRCAIGAWAAPGSRCR
jgi:hypothetical protein